MVPRAVGGGSPPPLDEKGRAAGAAEERLLRRSLGPTASAVLVDLCLDAETDADGVVVVRTSARRVAEHLGIGKDSAARALLRLSAAGLARRRRQATDGRGRFAGTTYELGSAAALSGFPRPGMADTVERSRPDKTDTVDHSSPVSASPVTAVFVPTRRRRRSQAAACTGLPGADQLCLLDPKTAGVDLLQEEPSS